MYFQKITGTRFGFVPYRGGAPAMQDLMAGRVDIMFDQAANAITQVRAGTIKAYAVMTEQRWHLAPDIPTIDEAGAQGLHVSYWHALFAPKATPAGHHRQGQCRRRQRARRSESAAKLCRAGPGYLAARATDAASARRFL